MSDEVVLHLGMPKTGTTALQVCFTRNRARLARLGVHYPPHESDTRALAGALMAGNGLALVPYLAPRREVGAAESQQVLDAVRQEITTSAARTVLYSSEVLFRHDTGRLGELHDLLGRDGVTVEAVVYVRDVAGHALSEYAQAVERRRLTATFAEFVAGEGEVGYHLNVIGPFKSLLDVLGPEHVRVRHYDTERAGLVDGFLTSVLDVPEHELAAFDRGSDTVNRSLTAREIEYMRAMNPRLAGKNAAVRASAGLLAQPPRGERRDWVTPAEAAILAERFTEKVAWTNRMFFPDGRYSLLGGTPVAEDRPPAPLTGEERYFCDCLVEVANPAGWRQAAAPA